MLNKLFQPRGKKADHTSSAPEKSEVEHSADSKNTAAKPKKQRPSSSKKAEPPKPSWSLNQFQVAEQEGKTRFHDLGLDLTLMHGIADSGFQYCSPIQAAALPHTLRGNDVIGKAQTGTGKTAAFLITIFNDLLLNPVETERFVGEPRALVIAPTRELVAQIADDAKELGRHTGLKVVSLIGGMDYQKQLDRLAEGLVDIVVATPGRLLDFTGRGDLYLDQVEILVIDEADRMLDMGFIPQVKRIVRLTPRKTHRQTLLFSATFTEDIIRLTEQWTHEPVRVEIEPERVATDTVDQKIYLVESSDKFKVLRNIVRQPDVVSIIIFANRRDETRRLHERLTKAGVKCGILSGEIPQNKRTRTLQDFKDGKITCLVATDVAGRGIHVDGISHVVNYTLPEEPEDYVHRIGRTGRAGATGTSISFACEDDAFLLPAIEAELGMKLPCEQPPEALLG
ncbi:ATP-dependent RNA helicase RhlB [Spongiibacter sp. KMU-158]|uniref:ATP-dependent RNA helicase RhlB n=1 Tax=Spongiibacter pelagi TaxID=2760804 RepID=A0A927C2U7_9GAMM|nr:ATP-dependent RNA helicase RhlB [Spongiibacter pelagi]MBD2858756.1 ATP-dependent RNA helicase RhlB [Spongiibacter pelagi]